MLCHKNCPFSNMGLRSEHANYLRLGGDPSQDLFGDVHLDGYEDFLPNSERAAAEAKNQAAEAKNQAALDEEQTEALEKAGLC